MNVPDHLKGIDALFHRLQRKLILRKRKAILTNRKATHIFTHLGIINRYRRLIVE